MVKIRYIIVLCLFALGGISCTGDFLRKPQGNDLYETDIFTSKDQLLNAVAQAYMSSLCMNISYQDWPPRTLAHISGEVNGRKFTWEPNIMISRTGMSATGNTIDDYSDNFEAIRRCFLIYNNIDMMPESEMSAAEIKQVKGEMLALVAYRYCKMFIQYGGVPVVGDLVDPGNSRIPRGSLQDVLDHIKTLCDDAFEMLPESWPDNFKGRCTKGVPLAIKAQALLYAARPLFNSPQPYLSMENTEDNDKICFGNYLESRWKDAYDAALETIAWCESHGYEVINTGSPMDDYGTAVSTPNNKEVILAFKHQHVSAPSGNGNYYYPRHQSGGANGMSLYQLKQYRTSADGDAAWPAPSENWTSFPDFQTRVESLEPRYWASAAPAGYEAKNNPGDYNWTPEGGLTSASNWEGRDQNEACGRRIKFWYKAGDRIWFDFPLYRVAYFYLAAAEAANEMPGYNTQSLQYLQKTRTRGGLTTMLTESDPDVLRGIIQREWAVEFYEENNRLFDVKHWKHPDIPNGMIGGEKYVTEFRYVNGNYGTTPGTYSGYRVAVSYNGYWSPNQYLNPFPSSEINKGYLGLAPGNGQNPGY